MLIRSLACVAAAAMSMNAAAANLRVDTLIPCFSSPPVVTSGACGSVTRFGGDSPGRIELLSSFSGFAFPPELNVPFSSTASAFVDLTTGIVGATTVSSGPSASGTVAWGQLLETVVFNVAGADPFTQTTITFEVGFDVTIAPEASATFTAGVIGNAPTSASNVQISRSYRRDVGGNLIVTGNSFSGNVVETQGNRFRGQITLLGLQPFISVQYGMSVGMNASSENAGAFRFIDLPSNVTWQSNSGVFLSAVPEPSGAWLLGLGLVGLVIWRSRPR